MPRILVLVPFPMSPSELGNRRLQLTKVDLDPDTEVHYQPVKAAPRTYVSHADYALADVSLLEAGLNAQKDGFDGVCIDTVSDSGVAALRSLLDIPVVGPGRVMFSTALMLGERFSIIAMWKEWFGLYKKVLVEMNLTHKCASMRAIDVTPDNRNLLQDKEDETFPKLLETAKQCITQDGADVICLGSTTMHQAGEWLAEKLSVPVINPGPLSYKTAENLCALSLSHSRAAYPNPNIPKRPMVHAMLDAAVEITANHPNEQLD